MPEQVYEYDNGGFFLGAIFAAVLLFLLLTFKKWAGLFGLGSIGGNAGAGAGAGAGSGSGAGAGGGCSACGDNAKYPPPPNFSTNPSTVVNPVLGYIAPTSKMGAQFSAPLGQPKTALNIFGQTVVVDSSNQ